MKPTPIGRKKTEAILEEIFGSSIHARRIQSIAGAVVGCIRGATLAVTLIGHALAKAANLSSKHAIKQVDRLLSNTLFAPWLYFATWVPYVVGQRKEIIVAMDWTEFDQDDQSTIALYLTTRHGRATPLVWKTVVKSELKGWRNAHEDAVLARLAGVLPQGVRVCVLADRGFGDPKRYRHLAKLGFDYVVRFRQGIKVTVCGETKTAGEWVPSNGRARRLEHALVTATKYPVAAVVCVKQAKMKEPWCLATSLSATATAMIVKLYAKRFSIEETFRDTKDIRFGMGLSQTRIRDPTRRDRLLFIAAIAIVFVTLLGAAGERLGMDRMLKANTSKKRTHSLFTQGMHYYDAIPTMSDDQLVPLMEAFACTLREQEAFNGLLGEI
jgi:hypothetical protein